MKSVHVLVWFSMFYLSVISRVIWAALIWSGLNMTWWQGMKYTVCQWFTKNFKNYCSLLKTNSINAFILDAHSFTASGPSSKDRIIWKNFASSFSQVTWKRLPLSLESDRLSLSLCCIRMRLSSFHTSSHIVVTHSLQNKLFVLCKRHVACHLFFVFFHCVLLQLTANALSIKFNVYSW